LEKIKWVHERVWSRILRAREIKVVQRIELIEGTEKGKDILQNGDGSLQVVPFRRGGEKARTSMKSRRHA